MRIKVGFLLIVSFLLVQDGFSQGKHDVVAQELVGTWTFVDLRDGAGQRIDTIWHPAIIIDAIRHPAKGNGWEIPEGPLRVYRANGTYSKQFTLVNIDNGKWHYNKKKRVIVQKVYYERPYRASAQYMINNGHAHRDKDGEYYGLVQEQVLVLTDSILVIREGSNWKRTFRKTLTE